jgi:hypothetical protein
VEQVVGVVADRHHGDGEQHPQDVGFGEALGEEPLDIGGGGQATTLDEARGEGGQGVQARVGQRLAIGWRR